jgi:hypothetical protein
MIMAYYVLDTVLKELHSLNTSVWNRYYYYFILIITILKMKKLKLLK